MVTAGGNQLCIWDLVGGGRLLRRLSNFQKTVTCVRMSPLAGPDSAAAPRMLAGSLDGHVKVWRGALLPEWHIQSFPYTNTPLVAIQNNLLSINLFVSCPRSLSSTHSRSLMLPSTHRRFCRSVSPRTASCLRWEWPTGLSPSVSTIDPGPCSRTALSACLRTARAVPP